MRLKALLTGAVAALALTLTSPAFAVDAANPDWPCVWRKTLALDAATIWDGPAIDLEKSQWRSNDAVRKLSEVLLTRRIKVEDAEAEIKKFAASVPEGERDKQMMDLFAAILTRTNDERKTVVNGIERFHKRQLARAAEIEKQGIKLPRQGEALSTEPISAADIDKLLPEEEAYKWDVRVFLERQQNIPLACEIPQLMDERAGALARAIRAEMKS
jgi:hypothetical protein